MFHSRRGLDLRACGVSSSQTVSNHGQIIANDFILQKRAPAGFASLSASLNEFARNLPCNRGHQGRVSRAGSGVQTEPKTGAVFPGRFCQRGNRDCGDLAGVGVRSKKIAGIKTVNVYSVGLYVDPSAARGALRSYRDRPAESLRTDQGFYDTLIKADNVDKCLVMNIAFGHVSSEQFWGAIQEQLAGPMKKANAEPALQEFGRNFDGIKFRKGLPMSFCMSKDALKCKVDGTETGVVHSKALCRSLLGVYLGSKAVSQDAKDSIGSGLASMLAD